MVVPSPPSGSFATVTDQIGDALAVHQVLDHRGDVLDVAVDVLGEEGAAPGAVVVELARAAPDAEHQPDVLVG